VELLARVRVIVAGQEKKTAVDGRSRASVPGGPGSKQNQEPERGLNPNAS